MLSGVLSLCLAAAMGQAPPAEAAWLKVVPANADIVVRVRGLEAAQGDLVKMVQAMSKSGGEMAAPALDQMVQQFNQRFGDAAAKAPFLAVISLPKPGEDVGAAPPFVVIVEAKEYDAVLKSVAGRTGKVTKGDGGLDTVATEEGQTLYATQGPGFVAFGGKKELVSAIAKPGQTLDQALAAPLKDRFLGGDLGVFVNVAALLETYGDEIEQVKAQMLAGMEAQAGGQSGEVAKTMVNGGFDALKVADQFVLSLDFAAEGLDLQGEVSVKPGSEAASKLANAKSGPGDMIGSLPDSATTFMYMNIDPKSIGGIQQMAMNFLTPSRGGDTEALKKAMDLVRESSGRESYVAQSGAGGKTFTMMVPADPAKAVEAATAMTKAMEGGFIKSVALTPNAETYEGFTLNKAVSTFDFAKLAAMQPNNPAGEAGLRKMLGGESITTWYGTDGKRMISVAASDWDAARAQIDAALSGKGSIGQTAGFQAIRAKLPKQANVLMLLSAQGLVQQVSTQLAAMMPGANVAVPGDLPKAPVFLGLSVTATTQGYQFSFSLPSAAGPIFEKGLAPMVQGLQGQIGQ